MFLMNFQVYIFPVPPGCGSKVYHMAVLAGAMEHSSEVRLVLSLCIVPAVTLYTCSQTQAGVAYMLWASCYPGLLLLSLLSPSWLGQLRQGTCLYWQVLEGHGI